jgi:hypothetical protein
MTPLRSRCQILQTYMRSILRSEYGTDKEDVYKILINNLWANSANFKHAEFILKSSATSLLTCYSVRIVTACSFTTYELTVLSYESSAKVYGAHKADWKSYWVKQKHVQEPCRMPMKLISRATLARVSDYLTGLKSEKHQWLHVLYYHNLIDDLWPETTELKPVKYILKIYKIFFCRKSTAITCIRYYSTTYDPSWPSSSLLLSGSTKRLKVCWGLS